MFIPSMLVANPIGFVKFAEIQIGYLSMEEENICSTGTGTNEPKACFQRLNRTVIYVR